MKSSLQIEYQVLELQSSMHLAINGIRCRGEWKSGYTEGHAAKKEVHRENFPAAPESGYLRRTLMTVF